MLSTMASSAGLKSRLFVVSNRLPVTIRKAPDANYVFERSSGGLATGLSGLAATTDFVWIGWPGKHLPESEVESIIMTLKSDYNAVPVLVDDETADKHYNGFSSE